jgi:hypothetical protein
MAPGAAEAPLISHPAGATDRLSTAPDLIGSSLRLGFGCASLGSRIGARPGLEALKAAYDAGVAWFDVAPAYGLGRAEFLLGDFLRGRRHHVSLTTKVGIAPPQRLNLMKHIYSVGRPVISLASGLRSSFHKIRATRNRRLPLTPELLETSIEQSLKRLRTDYVDYYALHDPHPEDVVRDDILRSLDRIVARGQARRVAVAGGPDACREALKVPETYKMLQLSVDHFIENRSALAGCGQTIVLHSVFGVKGASHRARRGQQLAALHPGALGDLSAARDLASHDSLLQQALALNVDGYVLTSMFSPAHFQSNLKVARRMALSQSPGNP